MLMRPSGIMSLTPQRKRSIPMSTRFPSSAPWSIPLYPDEPATRMTPAAAAREQPSAFLCWLDNYFRATPDERMEDEYIAYWN